MVKLYQEELVALIARVLNEEETQLTFCEDVQQLDILRQEKLLLHWYKGFLKVKVLIDRFLMVGERNSVHEI